jgi:hypothetical protein
MRTRRCLLLLLTLLAATVSASPQRGGEQSDAADRFLGVWSGTWENEAGGGGGIELTLEHEKGKPTTGKVSVTGESPFKATIASLSFDGATMTAKFDYPIDPGGDARVTATFDGDTVTGTWVLFEKGRTDVIDRGGWKGKRGAK